MIFKSLLAAGLTFAALALPVTATSAQDASSSAPPPAADAGAAPAAAPPAGPAQNWLKVCAPIKAPAAAPASTDATASSSQQPAPAAAATPTKARACVIQQTFVTPNHQFLGSLVLRNDPELGEASRLSLVVAVPLGVILPFGVTLRIDGGKPIGPYPFILCSPSSCIAQTAITETFVNSLKKAQKLNVLFKSGGNKDTIIPFDLAGFTTMYDGDAALTVDEYNKQTSGQSSLEKILQDRAEAARQARSADGTAPADASSSAPAQ